MEQKRVSFEVAKAIKEAGYPQSFYCPQYKENGELENGFTDLGEGCIYAPTYIDVWLWLWREKKWFIKIQPLKDKFHYQILDHHYDEWHSWGVLSMTGYLDPEEAIIAAIEYLVDNDSIK